MPVSVVTSRDAQAVSVNALVKESRAIAERIISVLANQFVMDRVLRNEGKATGGAVQFRKSSGLYADTPLEVVTEGAQIPLAQISVGDLDAVPVKKRALGVLVTREMIERNQRGKVEEQIQRIKNTILRDIDGAFFAALIAAITQTRAATAVWSGPTATIRKDILRAKAIIKASQATGTTGGNHFLGFEPDTLLLNPLSEEDLLASDEWNKIAYGTNATNTDSLPPRILGLKPMVSTSVAAGTAWVVESKTIGGYADEFPLESTELYPLQPNQAFRSDTSRATAGFIDQPLAGARITGV